MGKKKPTKKPATPQRPADWNMGYRPQFDPEYAGWLPPEDRTAATQREHERYVHDTPLVSEVFEGGYNAERPRIWELVEKAAAKGWVQAELMRDGAFKNISQIIGSCFVRNTLVMMADGSEKPIQRISVGDEVISHTGQKRRVDRVFYRPYTGTLHTFKVNGWESPVTMTDDHDCLVASVHGFEKKKARDVVQGERFLLPRSHESSRALQRAVEPEEVEETPYGFATRIERIDHQDVQAFPVYCCEVEEEHTLVVNGMAQGQCVGFGAGNMLLYASLLDSLVRKQQERILVPFVPYHYGRGRLHSGINGPGSGSLGSGQAKALQVDGYLAYDSENVDAVTWGDSIHWTQSIEYTWSDGKKIKPEFIEAAQKHLCPNVARVATTEEAQKLADSYYVFTIASNWGGRMKCPVTDGVLLNEKTGSWAHQMWVLDYIDHPKLGRLWWIGNNWKYPHGKDPGGEWDNNTGAPEGGFYVKDSDLAYILRQRDSFAFSDPQGFVDRSREFTWLMG